MLNRKNILIHILSLGILCAGFVLCRFVFLDLHGMQAWPELLFEAGLVVLAVSFFLKGKVTPLCTAFAYSIGFLAGFLFQTDGVDPGGGTTNNLWIIWTAVFAGLVAIGIIGDIICSARKLRKETL